MGNGVRALRAARGAPFDRSHPYTLLDGRGRALLGGTDATDPAAVAALTDARDVVRRAAIANGTATDPFELAGTGPA